MRLDSVPEVTAVRGTPAPTIRCPHSRCGPCDECLRALVIARQRAAQLGFAIEAAQVRESALAYEDRKRAGLTMGVGGTCRPERDVHAPLDVESAWLDPLGHPQNVDELNFEEG